VGHVKCLFIIGNGFDLAHGLPTTYEDFHQYLIRRYPEAEDLNVTFDISSIHTPDGGELYDESEVASFLIKVISEAEEYGQWSDFEASLGRLNLEEYLAEMASWLDDDDDDDLWKRARRNEDTSRHFYRVVTKIHDIFPEWIDSIHLRGVKPKKSFMNIIDKKNDLFLTFNYTRVLEEIYEVENVFHIHGEQGGPVIIGHGENRDEDFYYRYTGSEYYLNDLHKALRKDTEGVIRQSNIFFRGLKNIETIFSYGFSFSDVDLPYIRGIMNSHNTKNVTWYLNNFDNEEKRARYQDKIRSCGFKGDFGVFTRKTNRKTLK
jgi:hypothetical protein